MPIDYSKYNDNFRTEVRPAILARAQHRCEFCDIVDRREYHRHGDGTLCQMVSGVYQRGDRYICHATGLPEKVRHKLIILTIAHLDQTTTNDDPANLRALCQKCHLSYDQQARKHQQLNLLDAPKTTEEALDTLFGQADG